MGTLRSYRDLIGVYARWAAKRTKSRPLTMLARAILISSGMLGVGLPAHAMEWSVTSQVTINGQTQTHQQTIIEPYCNASTTACPFDLLSIPELKTIVKVSFGITPPGGFPMIGLLNLFCGTQFLGGAQNYGGFNGTIYGVTIGPYNFNTCNEQYTLQITATAPLANFQVSPGVNQLLRGPK